MQQLVQEEIIKLQPRGTLTIPKKLRQSIGLKENSFIRIKRKRYQLIIEPVRILPYPVRGYTVKELENFFKLDEKETKELKENNLL